MEKDDFLVKEPSMRRWGQNWDLQNQMTFGRFIAKLTNQWHQEIGSDSFDSTLVLSSNVLGLSIVYS